MLLGFKGQLISKANCQAVNSTKKRMNEFVFTTQMCGKQRTRGLFTPRKIILKSSKMEEFWSDL